MLEYLLQTQAAATLGGFLTGPEADLHIPAFCDIEVAAGLRRAILRDLLTPERAELAIRHHLDLPLTRHGHTALLPRILELRANVSAYDTGYVALAEALGATLVTADERLGRAVRTHTAVAVLP